MLIQLAVIFGGFVVLLSLARFCIKNLAYILLCLFWAAYGCVFLGAYIGLQLGIIQ